MKYQYGTFFTDMTHNCNLRCRFCSNDWSKIKGNVNVSKETFNKFIQLIPLVPDNNFLICCKFEATIHPQFFERLESIPREYKSKTRMTTNLARHFTKEEIKRWSNSPLGTLQISVDTFDPKLYEEYRVGAKFNTFMANLENLVEVFNGNPDSPKLRYISMIFKQNFYEVESITEKLHTKYMAVENEFRTPFKWSIKYNDSQWIKKSLISEPDWNDMTERLSKLPYKIKLFNPKGPMQLFSYIDNQVVYIPEKGISTINFWGSSDGTIFSPDKGSEDLPEEFRQDFNINDIDNPYDYFNQFT